MTQRASFPVGWTPLLPVVGFCTSHTLYKLRTCGRRAFSYPDRQPGTR